MSILQPSEIVTEPPVNRFLCSDFDLEPLRSIPRQDSCVASIPKDEKARTDFIKDSLAIFNDDTFLDELAPGLRIEQEADIIAKRLYLDDKDLFKKEDVAQFLGKRGELNVLTLEKYMNHFDFARMRLEDAFRHFCSKLFLRGESQTIDKILEQFARRYWECNRNGAFPNQDTVYTIVYSLLLLNTDLHVAHINNKISKHDFVKNTLATVQACSLSDSTSEITLGSVSSKTNFSSRSSSFGLDSDHISLSSRTSFSGDDLTTLLKEMYSSVKHNQIPQPFEYKSRRRSSSMGMIGNLGLTRSQSVHTLRKVKSKLSSRPSTPSFYKCDSRNIFHTGSSNVGPADSPLPKSKIEPTIASPKSETAGYFKSGMLIRKHLFERTSKKAQNRQWKNCFVVVDRGDLKMFKAVKGRLGGDGSELTDIAMQMGHISLRHSLTIALPSPGYSPSRPYVFAVQLPNGGVYLFQTGSRDHIQEWVNVCNYWAARESKEPLSGGVCNIDYGWKKHFEPKSKLSIDIRLPVGYDDHASINEWVQPTNPMIRSGLSEHLQLQTLVQYNKSLEKELAEHMELRSIIFQRFSPKSSNMTRSFSNWERKSQYLLRELIKYQTYADSLQQALESSPKSEEIGKSFSNGQRQPNSDVFIPSPLRQSQRSVTAPATFSSLTDDGLDGLTQSNTFRWAGTNEVITEKIGEKGALYESVIPDLAELEIDDESVYELCRDHLSSTESE